MSNSNIGSFPQSYVDEINQQIVGNGENWGNGTWRENKGSFWRTESIFSQWKVLQQYTEQRTKICSVWVSAYLELKWLSFQKLLFQAIRFKILGMRYKFTWQMKLAIWNENKDVQSNTLHSDGTSKKNSYLIRLMYPPFRQVYDVLVADNIIIRTFCPFFL